MKGSVALASMVGATRRVWWKINIVIDEKSLGPLSSPPAMSCRVDAARTFHRGSPGPRDRDSQNWQRIRHPEMPLCCRLPSRRRNHTAPIERQIMEARLVGVDRTNEAWRAPPRFDRTITRRGSGDHSGDRAETKMHTSNCRVRCCPPRVSAVRLPCSRSVLPS